MLYYNDTERVDTLSPKTDAAKKVVNLKQQLLNEFMTFPMFVEFVPGINKESGGKMNDPTYGIRLKSELSNNDGNETWQYSKNPPRVGKSGEKIFNKRMLELKGYIRIDEYDFELAVYLRFFCPNCADNDLPSNNKFFRFINESKKARNVVGVNKIKSKALFMLTSDDERVLSLNDMKTICSFWGLPFKTTADRDMLSSKILTECESREKIKTGTGWEEFLNVVKVDDSTKLRAMVNELFNKKIVMLDKPTGGNNILRLAEDGKPKGTELCRVSVRVTKEDALYDYLKKNADIRIDLTQALEDADKPKIEDIERNQ